MVFAPKRGGVQVLLDLLTVVLPVLLWLAAANYAVVFARQEPFAQKICSPLLASAFALHVLFLVLRYLAFERYPIANSPEALTVIAASIVGVYLYVERIQKNQSTGVFLVSVAALVQTVASSFLPHVGPARTDLMAKPLFGLHTLSAAFGYTAFAVGAVYGLMFLLLYRALKAKEFGLVFERLPSLDVLSRMSFGATLVGWVFLSLTMALGVVMSFGLFPNFYKDPQFIIAIVVWCIYAVGIWTYVVHGWRGARNVAVSLVGFGVVVFGFLGKAFLWSSFHAFFT